MAGDFKVTVKLQAVKADIEQLRKDVEEQFETSIKVKFDMGSTNKEGSVANAKASFSSLNTVLEQSKVKTEGLQGARKRLSVETARLIGIGKVDTAAKIDDMKVEAARLVLTDKQTVHARKRLQEEGRTYRERAREITNFSKLSDEANRYYTQFSKNIGKNSALNARWQSTMTRLADPMSFAGKTTADRTAGARAELAQLMNESEKAGVSVETLGQRLNRLFGAHLNTALVMGALHALQQSLVMVYQNVVGLDKATVDLQIASGKSRDEVKGMMRDYSQTAKSLGATTLEVANSADAYLRQGKTVSEANTLIQNSMMLSKLGQLDSASASKYLTSTMKGYKISVEDSIGVVDKLTAVDMAAAINAGEIAEGISGTAVSADIAGISLDKLIGYIATVGEVTQGSGEELGTFFRSLTARMGNVKAGNLIDVEDGSLLSNVETVLTGYGIALRDSNSEFRNFGDVLDEVAGKWDTFGTVAQRAIAVAFAG